MQSSNMKIRKHGFLILSILLWMVAYIIVVIAAKFLTGFIPTCWKWGNRSDAKTVLFWNTIFGDENFLFGKDDVFKNCLDKCIATHYRYILNIENFDAILFHGINNEFDITDLPSYRRTHQKYVFVTLESPMNRNVPEGFEYFFNWTMTYMIDSDVVRPYGFVEKIEGDKIVAPSIDTQWVSSLDSQVAEKLVLLNKSRLAIWFRSNCNTPSLRESYVEELEKHMAIKKFGKCSENTGCPKERECFKTLIEPHYFFYLSFENSLCDDYVTEKLFDALRNEKLDGDNYNTLSHLTPGEVNSDVLQLADFINVCITENIKIPL